jgi:hypothetical protein
MTDEMTAGNTGTRDVTADMQVSQQQAALTQLVVTVGRAQRFGSSVCS